MYENRGRKTTNKQANDKNPNERHHKESNLLRENQVFITVKMVKEVFGEVKDVGD